MERYAEKPAFVTLKDHKENFVSKKPCRLINPSKSEIGIVSKELLEQVINKVTKDSGVNQWINTANVIEWFNNMPNRSAN